MQKEVAVVMLAIVLAQFLLYIVADAIYGGGYRRVRRLTKELQDLTERYSAEVAENRRVEAEWRAERIVVTGSLKRANDMLTEKDNDLESMHQEFGRLNELILELQEDLRFISQHYMSAGTRDANNRLIGHGYEGFLRKPIHNDGTEKTTK